MCHVKFIMRVTALMNILILDPSTTHTVLFLFIICCLVFRKATRFSTQHRHYTVITFAGKLTIYYVACSYLWWIQQGLTWRFKPTLTRVRVIEACCVIGIYTTIKSISVSKFVNIRALGIKGTVDRFENSGHFSFFPTWTCHEHLAVNVLDTFLIAEVWGYGDIIIQ